MAEFLVSHGRELLLFLLVGATVALLYYLYGSRKRGQRLESYRNIPLLDDDAGQQSGKVSKDE